MTDRETMPAWRETIAASVETLRRIAGTTEDEFLQIGSALQGFYQRSTEISRLAGSLVDLVSGERTLALTNRLHSMIGEMGEYLAEARASTGSGCAVLQKMLMRLEGLSDSLDGFQKMNKTLRMLGISTKIESARLGDKGRGFLNLAMDAEKLSHRVTEKFASICSHRLRLAEMITSNLDKIRSTETLHGERITSTLKSAGESLQELISVNERCTQLGASIVGISNGVTASIGQVVSSLQFHDIIRQQVEHVYEALERLSDHMAGQGQVGADTDGSRTMVVEAGDVCELQEAQLGFASSELHAAVRAIIENLRDVARQQSEMASQIGSAAGVTDSGGASFVEVMSRGMATITGVLSSCARADRELADTMRQAVHTVSEISSFVTDIQYIGSEIDLIALNSQIKAAHTGSEGAALGVLAEAIQRLSVVALRHTDAVSTTLTGFTAETAQLSADETGEEAGSGSRIEATERELDEILRILGEMNAELNSLLSGLNGLVVSLTGDIELTVKEIDVHQRVGSMTDDVMTGLERIVAEARRIEPASSEFTQNLQHMEARYTMDSERMIHEAVARKRGILFEVAGKSEGTPSSGEESEFGGNVDLF